MEVKGTALLAIRDFVKKNHENAFEKWLNNLPNDSKAIYSDTIDSTKWYPVDQAASLPTKTICTMFFEGNEMMGAWECGRYSAEKALTGIYKIFVRASSPGFIITRAKDIFARYYRPMEMQIADKTSKSVVLHIVNTEKSDAIIEHRIAGWIEKALEISGTISPQVRITKSITKGDKITEFDIRWN